MSFSNMFIILSFCVSWAKLPTKQTLVKIIFFIFHHKEVGCISNHLEVQDNWPDILINLHCSKYWAKIYVNALDTCYTHKWAIKYILICSLLITITMATIINFSQDTLTGQTRSEIYKQQIWERHRLSDKCENLCSNWITLG